MLLPWQIQNCLMLSVKMFRGRSRVSVLTFPYSLIHQKSSDHSFACSNSYKCFLEIVSSNNNQILNACVSVFEMENGKQVVLMLLYCDINIISIYTTLLWNAWFWFVTSCGLTCISPDQTALAARCIPMCLF